MNIKANCGSGWEPLIWKTELPAFLKTQPKAENYIQSRFRKSILKSNTATARFAQEGNNVCGDNYLIKQLNNSRLIAAISDGMGKGYLAYQESGNTLKFVDEITKTAISTETGLQILNTFYFIQDYLEKYSTLDLFGNQTDPKGNSHFYKMGAASSYIFHQDDNSFVKVTNTGLPFGIEEMIEAKKYPHPGRGFDYYGERRNF
jgi:serine phosphatase RsbU (regulator of sigma subunit)